MNPLILIPARGGSKGIPGKNLREVGGLSLTARAIRTALGACREIGSGRVVVDTDDETIAAEGRRWGAEIPYLRPAHLATDTTGSLEVIRHALAQLGITADDHRPVVLIQATSPLVPVSHVVEVIRTFAVGRGDPVISVAQPHTHPEWTFTLDAGTRLTPWSATTQSVRRQDLPTVWAPSGAVYVASASHLLAGGAFIEPGRTRGVALTATFAIDVDEESDLTCADALASRQIRAIQISDRSIGVGAPCFIIAEAGVNHDGDVEEAHRLIDAAADIGADAVKFQTWQTALLVRPGTPKADYQLVADPNADQFAMLERLELPYAAHPDLKAHAEERGLVFLSTPDEIVSARFLSSLGVAAIKIGSAELDNLPYLAQLSRFGLPLLLSTGMGTIQEVAAAVDCISANGNPPLALFHAVSAYPAPAETINLRAMNTLARAFQVPVGLSDHYPGVEAALAAVGIGLPLWEKHLTRDRSRTGPDHLASLEPDEFAHQITMVRTAERALGDGTKTPRGVEAETRSVVRKRLCAVRDLPAGEQLAVEDLMALRAEYGLSVSCLDHVVGKTMRSAIKAGDALCEEHLR